MEEVSVKVDSVSKIYKLYHKPTDRLKDEFGFSKKKRFQEHHALSNVSFEVKKGEAVGIIGTNGSGKSTILKIITGVLNQTEGTVVVNGRISALLELGAGFNMEYTGIENVYLNGTMIGFSNQEIDERLQNIIEFADIGEFIHQPVKTYSSGMFVRLAFAVAINIDPEILIVDEALSVGDIFFQAKCYRKFEEFKNMGKTIIFVSHDLSSISKYCDRVILLDKGIKVDEGKPKEIVDLYKQILVHQTADQREEAHLHAMQADAMWNGIFDHNPDTLEYGDRRAQIVGFQLIDDKQIPTNTVEKGKELTMKIKILFNADVEEPIYAFTIKELKGTEITGTNTMFEKIPVTPKKQGDIDIVSFTQKIDLQGGEYLISFGCTGYDGADFVVYHRLYDVCSITVVSTKNTVGFYDMNSKITVTKGE